VDKETLAYLNLYAVLGSITNLCELVPEAAELAKPPKPVAVGFRVKGGPAATLTFADGRCEFAEGVGAANVLLPFGSPEKFNGLIAGTVSPVPSKGFTKIGFLLKQFTPLTELLEKYMRADAESLKDAKFFDTSTRLMFYTVAAALSQVANHDEIGRFSAAHTLDGDISFAIKDGPAATLRVQGGHFTTIKAPAANPRAVMEFGSIELARDLFDGKVNALGCIGTGQIAMKGMISMLDNLNRVLDRVALYLA
jgi:hypothetical protein